MPLRPEDINKLRGLKNQLQTNEAAVRAQRAAEARQRAINAESSQQDSPAQPKLKRGGQRFVDANQLFSGEVRPGDEAWDTVRTPRSESQRMADRYHGRFYRRIQGGAHHKG